MDIVEYVDLVRKAMAEKGMTNEELANAGQISPAQVSRVLSGKSKPGLKFIDIASKVLGVRMDSPIHRPDINYLAGMMNDDQFEEWLNNGQWILDRDERKKRG